MILKPEEIALKIERSRKHYPDVADTLRAYADIVQKVAEMDPSGIADAAWFCPYCDGVEDHAPDCAYITARKLRGLKVSE